MRVAILGPAHLGPLLPRLRLTSEQQAALPQTTVTTPLAPLAVGLLERGHEVLFVTLSDAVRGELILGGDGLRVRVGPYRARHRARDVFAAERRYLHGVLGSEPCDVVHVHWGYEYALAALAAPHPTVITLRDWAPTIFRMLPDPYRAVRLAMYLRVLFSGRRFTVPSPYMQQKVARWARGPVTLVPNGLPDEAFDLRADGPPHRRPVVLAVNNGFQRRKNVTALLQAFPAVRSRIPDCTLRLVGQGYGPGGDAHTWANARGLADSVSFSGALPATGVAEAMARAALFVHPALEESFGMVVAEAMAHGLPVVAGRRSGAVPWVLDHGHAGVLTDVTSPSDLADSIVRVLLDPQAWQHYSGAGYGRVRYTFRLSAVLDAYEDVYARVAGEQATPSRQGWRPLRSNRP